MRLAKLRTSGIFPACTSFPRPKSGALPGRRLSAACGSRIEKLCIFSMTRSPQSILAQSSTLRSEEHTSELQSPCNLVCRLLLEKKKKKKKLRKKQHTINHEAQI